MNKINSDFYIIQYAPNDEGIPHFMDKEWIPELPDYDIYVRPPCAKNFEKKYTLKIKSYQLDGDYFINDNLVSYDFLELCEDLNVNFIHIPTDIKLFRNKTPAKKYYTFFVLDYLSILDKNKSIFTISEDIDSGKLNTPEDRGLDKTYYDKIDRFCIVDDVFSHLFFCQDISQFVCSGVFKEKFESLRLKGITFKPIDNEYKYDAWEGWL
ncbi:imm11 family protein [Mixta intestinalis]|uniref:Immunity MXAN-0049 protein domain-containing protein n=1 Tax=Mixta intestinalis TaxID=1615494 RepID=A0A6P1Q5I6_9GAMM|nr:DUF1629 domain-containing protein [Mixta intestinalis]QHM73337.1 hypothetical protein C7M51_03684 [Mixta intestinalis]